jgi:serine/threonine protein kinase
MSNCLCLACDRSNSITTRFCTQCGAKLQIQERYRALKVIGQGGFGKTFLAQDESKPSQPRCVIKQFAFETINPNASQGTLDVAIRLFEQEAKRLDDLGKHPQIPELLSFTIHEGKQYLIQEFIDGETLEQELARVGAFSEQQVRDVLVEVLQILEFVHSKSVIHRDISPDNIIRRRSDQKLVLVDFGAAKHATATLLAKTGTGIGKPSYGAPEQMLGKSVFQSDLFGLGVTCLHLLTNVEPFTLYDVLENEYQWRQFLNGKLVSNEFGKLLDRLTAYRVKERPSSVAEILKELGVKRETLIAVNTFSGVYSFKAEDLQSEHRVSMLSSITNKPATKTSSNNPDSNQNIAKRSFELISARGIDYQELEDLLKEKKWYKADELTNYLMLEAAKQKDSLNLNTDDIAALPYEDLQTIDRLWVHYSNSKFGFSIQKRIWLDCGGKIDEYDDKVCEKFGARIGWYNIDISEWIEYGEFIDSIKNVQNPLLGSLPAILLPYTPLDWEELIYDLLSHRAFQSLKNEYKELEKLLKAREWRKADELTTKLMPKLKPRKVAAYKTYYTSNSIESFPCEDIKRIDQLWVHYSNGKFGFSVQKKIWLECGGDVGNFRNLVDFGLKIGWYYPKKWFGHKKDRWKTYDEFMADTQNAQHSLTGSLPLTSHGWWYRLEYMDSAWWGGWALFQRQDL